MPSIKVRLFLNLQEKLFCDIYSEEKKFSELPVGCGGTFAFFPNIFAGKVTSRQDEGRRSVSESITVS